MIRLNGLVETVLNNFDSLVMPICLPKPYYGVEEPKIKEFVVAGWGKLDDNQGEAEILRKGVANEVLHKLSVPIYEKSRCYNVFEGVDETHICAGYVFKRQFILIYYFLPLNHSHSLFPIPHSPFPIAHSPLLITHLLIPHSRSHSILSNNSMIILILGVLKVKILVMVTVGALWWTKLMD